MRNFNINILASVQTAIGKQDYQIREPLSRSRNAAGFFITTFDIPKNMSGSVQPVNAKQFKSLGLDFKKSYIKIYDTKFIEIIGRDNNSSQVIWDGYVWEVAESTNWFLTGNWNFVMCVRIDKYDG